MKTSLIMVLLVIFVSVILCVPTTDASPLWGWEVRNDVVAGTGLEPSGTTTAALACEALIASGAKEVLAPANASDIIYLWKKTQYPEVFINGTHRIKTKNGFINDTSQKYERGGMIPICDEDDILIRYKVETADSGVINLDLQGRPL